MAAKVTDDNVISVDAIALANANTGLTPRADFDIAKSLAERGTEFQGASVQVAALGVIKFWSDSHDSVALKLDPDDAAEKMSLAAATTEVFGNTAKSASLLVRAARSVIMQAVYGKRPKQGKGKTKKTAYDLRILQGAYDDAGRTVANGIKFACIVAGLHMTKDGEASPARLLALFNVASGFVFKRADYAPLGAQVVKGDDKVYADNKSRIGFVHDDKPDVVRASVKTLLDRHLPKNENEDSDDDMQVAEAVDLIIAFLKDKTTANVIEATRGKLKDLSAAIIAFDNRNTAAPKASKAKA